MVFLLQLCRPQAGLVQVIRQRHDGRGTGVAANNPQRIIGRSNELGRDGGKLLAKVVARTIALRDKHPLDFRLINRAARLRLKAHAPPGEDHLATGIIGGQHHVIVQHPEDFHLLFNASPFEAITSRYQAKESLG